MFLKSANPARGRANENRVSGHEHDPPAAPCSLHLRIACSLSLLAAPLHLSRIATCSLVLRLASGHCNTRTFASSSLLLVPQTLGPLICAPCLLRLLPSPSSLLPGPRSTRSCPSNPDALAFCCLLHAGVSAPEYLCVFVYLSLFSLALSFSASLCLRASALLGSTAF